MKRGPLPYPAAHSNPAVMLLDDAIYHGESHPTFFADRFRREEWFKNAVHSRRVHSTTRVLDADAHKRTGPRIRMQTRFTLIEFDCSGHDRQLSTFGHRLRGIDNNINQHL